GKVGQPNPFEFGPDDIRKPMNLDGAEVAFQAFVDPYAKANFFLSVTKEGIDVEEGYAQFVTLPYDLTAKVGKFKAMFGKDNTWHAHVRPWVDQPLVHPRPHVRVPGAVLRSEEHTSELQSQSNLVCLL